MLENILIRWKFILDQFEEEAKKLLAKELCKITPSKPNFEVDWRMSEGFDDNIYRFNYRIKVCPVYQAEDIESVDLFDYFSKIIANMPAEDLERLDKSLKSMQKEMSLPYLLENSILPCCHLLPEIGMIVFKIKGKCMSANFVNTEQKQKI